MHHSGSHTKGAGVSAELCETLLSNRKQFFRRDLLNCLWSLQTPTQFKTEVPWQKRQYALNVLVQKFVICFMQTCILTYIYIYIYIYIYEFLWICVWSHMLYDYSQCTANKPANLSELGFVKTYWIYLNNILPQWKCLDGCVA